MTFKIRSVSFCLFVCGIVSCSVAQKDVKNNIQSIPISGLVDTFEGEQGEIIRRYGIPDNAHSNGMGVITWTYCSHSAQPVVIQFDNSGAVMNPFDFSSPNCESAHGF